jgi:hypothetical protein
MALAGSEIATPTDPQNLRFIRNVVISGDIRHEIMGSLKNTPYFDVKQNHLFEILTWDSSGKKGMIVLIHSGTGRSLGCAIYERIGGGNFEFVNGEPYCLFSSPSGRFDRDSMSVKFFGKVRQWPESAPLDDSFELFYDKIHGAFCDKESKSQKFRCTKEATQQ